MKYLLISFLVLSHLGLFAQNLPPIFEHTPKAIAPNKVLTVFPKSTFLENLLLLPNGDLLVDNHTAGIVYRIAPNGNSSEFAKVKGKVTGIAAYSNKGYILTGFDVQEKAVLFSIDKKGNVKELMKLPDAIFLNGITHWQGDNFLIADSYKGCVWLVDANKKTATVWADNELLKRQSTENPTPAANGIKIFGNKVYVSNTQKKQLLSIEIKANKALQPKVAVDSVNIDDFIFDKDGTVYATTHIYNKVIKIKPNKQVSILADVPQGVAGCTACVLKKNKNGSILYICTNGGMLLPPSSGIEESKIITLSLN